MLIFLQICCIYFQFNNMNYPYRTLFIFLNIMSSERLMQLESTNPEFIFQQHMRQSQIGPWSHYEQPLEAIQSQRVNCMPLGSQDYHSSQPFFKNNVIKVINIQSNSTEKKKSQSFLPLKSDRIIENWLPSQIPQTFKLHPEFKKKQIKINKQSLTIVGKSAQGAQDAKQIQQYRKNISQSIRPKKLSLQKYSFSSLHQQQQQIFSPHQKDISCQTTFYQIPPHISTINQKSLNQSLFKKNNPENRFQKIMIKALRNNSKTITNQNGIILEIVSQLPSIFKNNDRSNKNVHFEQL